MRFGYCINGMIMQSALVRNPKPSEGEVKVESANNRRRCGWGAHLAADL